MKNVLLINIGNTNIAFVFFSLNKNNKMKVFKFKTNDLDSNNYYELLSKTVLKNFDEIDFALVASVVKEKNKLFKNFFVQQKIKNYFISYRDLDWMNLSNINDVKQLGNDMIAQLFYLTSLYQEALVISLGTASLIYHYKNNKLSGCIILPGITQSIKNLENSTDIKNIKINQSKNSFGLTTNEAISIGLLETIKLIVKEKSTSDKTKIICTGGNQKYFKNEQWEFIEDLEIKGLLMFLKNKF